MAATDFATQADGSCDGFCDGFEKSCFPKEVLEEDGFCDRF